MAVSTAAASATTAAAYSRRMRRRQQQFIMYPLQLAIPPVTADCRLGTVAPVPLPQTHVGESRKTQSACDPAEAPTQHAEATTACWVPVCFLLLSNDELEVSKSRQEEHEQKLVGISIGSCICQDWTESCLSSLVPEWWR
jgi:hypothetical protein